MPCDAAAPVLRDLLRALSNESRRVTQKARSRRERPCAQSINRGGLVCAKPVIPVLHLGMVTSWSARHGEAGAGGTGQGARPDRRMGPRLVRVAQGVWGGRHRLTRRAGHRSPERDQAADPTRCCQGLHWRRSIGAMDDTKSDDLIRRNHELLAAAAKAWSDFMGTVARIDHARQQERMWRARWYGWPKASRHRSRPERED